MARAAVDRLVLGAFLTGWRMVRWVPEPVARALFAGIADVAWRRRVAPVRQLEANLRRVLGPDAPGDVVRATSRRGMRSYLRYWCDAFRLPVWPPERVTGGVRVVGDVDAYDAALASGSGFIAALPHMGNWDHAGAWSCRQGGDVVTVAERLRPEQLYERFVAYRESLGMEVLPLSGSRELVDTLAQRLREGNVVSLLADRDLRETGIEVCFFGEPARMPAGPALLAMRTGAPLHPVTVSYEPQGILIRFHPRVEVPAGGTTRARVSAMTQAVATAFEAAVAEHPHDWHMVQPLWTADLPAGRTGARLPGRAAGG